MHPMTRGVDGACYACQVHQRVRSVPRHRRRPVARPPARRGDQVGAPRGNPPSVSPSTRRRPPPHRRFFAQLQPARHDRGAAWVHVARGDARRGEQGARRRGPLRRLVGLFVCLYVVAAGFLRGCPAFPRPATTARRTCALPRKNRFIGADQPLLSRARLTCGICTAAHIGTGTAHRRPHLHRDCAHRCHVGTGTALVPPASAPGLGSCLPHLHRDRAHARPVSGACSTVRRESVCA